MINDSLYQYIKDSAIDTGVKVIFMGDTAQIKPVGQVHISKALDNPKDSYELTKVERTGDNPLLAESMNIRTTKSAEPFSLESASNALGEGVTFTRDLESFYNSFIELLKSEEFKDNKLLARIVSGTNAKVAETNKLVRRGLFGKIADETEYLPGDIIMGYDNFEVDYRTKEPKIINSGDYIVINSSKEKEGKWGDTEVKYYDLVLKDIIDDSKAVVNIKMLSKNNDEKVYESVAEQYERLRIDVIKVSSSPQERAKGFANLSAFKSKYGTNKNMVANGRTKIKKTLDYGYAHTIHKSQGGTYKYVFVNSTDIYKFPDAELQRQLKYVAVTRAQKHAYILYNKSNVVEDFSYNPSNMMLTEDMFGGDALPFGYESTMSLEELKRICK